MEEIREHERVETTIGDLIAAIADAAQEASIAESDVNALTHFILMRLLNRNVTE